MAFWTAPDCARALEGSAAEAKDVINPSMSFRRVKMPR